MDLWNLPGGMVECGESPWEGVVREVREEVGLDVEVIRLVGVYSKKKNDDVIFSFVCKKVNGVEMLTDEADEVAYFSLENLPQNLSPKHVERIIDAIQEKREVVMKIQSDQSGMDLLARIYK